MEQVIPGEEVIPGEQVTLFLNRNFLPARDLARDRTWASSIHAEHPSALEVVVIGDQLTSLGAPPFTGIHNTPEFFHLHGTSNKEGSYPYNSQEVIPHDP